MCFVVLFLVGFGLGSCTDQGTAIGMERMGSTWAEFRFKLEYDLGIFQNNSLVLITVLSLPHPFGLGFDRCNFKSFVGLQTFNYWVSSMVFFMGFCVLEVKKV